jgi:phage terminase large subunit-like protein
VLPDALKDADPAELERLRALLQSHVAERQLELYKPYPKQNEFHKAGADPKVRERLLIAGNQLGKTWSAGFETAMHLTGRYPDWWEGATFPHPIAAWAAGVTGEVTRDSVQRVLSGRINALGTGAIPADAIKDKAMKRGVSDAIDTLVIRHGGGGDVQAGESLLGFKSYDQGREKFQSESLDWVWLDEEPPADIYTEALTRTNATDGILAMTFTPLMGMSEVVRRFLIEKVAGTHVTNMTIEDALHYTPEQRAAIIAGYPAHEREARAKGIPTMGSGLIFPVAEDSIVVEPFAIPKHWPQIAGIDLGWDHPTAAARLAWDRDADVVYLVSDYRQAEAVPLIHAAAIKGWGEWIPVAWPHDGLQHDKGSGEALAAQYRKHGLKMLPDKATNPPKKGELEGTGGNGVEAPVQEMLERMLTGRWKVFKNCQGWLEERRMYHRKDGKIVKEVDDTISASRYAYMMLRHAITKPVTEVFDTASTFEPADEGMGFLG